MRSQKTTTAPAFRLFTAATVAAFGLLIAGCGGASMAGSATDWTLNGLTAYGGNPTVTIQPTTGATNQGSFSVPTSSSLLSANTPIFLEATFAAEIPGVNSTVYTSAATTTIGTFTAVWSQVLPSGQTTPVATFNSSTGTTFTGTTSVAPNVLLSGDSGNFMTVSAAGPVTVKIHVTLTTADGSTKTKDFYTTLNITAAAGA